MGVYEVTQDQYERVMGTNPSGFEGRSNPVERVHWDDAVEFCRKLSSLPKEKSAGRVYRLPTEAEWEYACRAGTATEYSFGDDASELAEYAWFGNNSGDRMIDVLNIWNTDNDNYGKRLLDNNCQAHPVGEKLPNAWGLYDMHGNVAEWCQDRHGDYPSGSVTDPRGSSAAESARDSPNQLVGIGAQLGFDDGYTLVEEVVDGGPAADDGRLIKGDTIIGIDPDGPEGPTELIDVVEMELPKVVDHIRGKSNTQVTLQVRKEAGGTEEYILTRQAIGSNRVMRGGSWGRPASPCRSADRDFSTAYGRGNLLGFRVVMSPSVAGGE